MPIIDITNKKFNRWNVLEKATRDKHGKGQWLCECECGTQRIVAASSLRKGLSKSCGCYKHETLSKGFKEISGAFWRKFERHADKRGIEFLITIEEAWEIFLNQDRKCALSGVDLCFVNNYDTYLDQSASPDRINNSKPYNKENFQWVHKRVNRIKSVLSDEELLFWCSKIINYSKVKPRDFDSNEIKWNS